MKSFLTGSRVYGTPNAESDVDLCVLISYDDMKTLVDASKHEASGSGIPRAMSVKFGELNLVMTWDEKCFAEWKMATEDLIKAKPVTRDDAVAHFKRIEAIREVKKELHTDDPFIEIGDLIYLDAALLGD